jgi:transglutaminase-like putative cysteine protease
VNFGREKRVLLGWLALFAPLPLPLNDLLEWPVFAAYTLIVIFFLRRAMQDSGEWLPNWASNVLGLLYLPFLWLDLRTLWRGQIVKPLVHLILFTLAVKLFGLRRERDKWHALFGAFFLFLAGTATSVSPAIVLFMVGYLALGMFTLTRFAYLHVLAGFGHREREPAPLPLRGFLIFATVATVVIAIPLFAFLPRVRTPYILGRGTGTGTIIHGTGFSDEMTLNGIGSIRGDRTVALRFAYDGTEPVAGERRFKVTTYERFVGTTWRRAPLQASGLRFSGGLFRVQGGAPTHWMTVWRQRLDSSGMPLPVETLSIAAPAWRLDRDRGGGVFFAFPPNEVTQYRVGTTDAPVLVGLPPDPAGDAALDTSGVTERMRGLAATAAEQGTAEQRARAIESFLIRNYSYSLDLTPPAAANPIDDFLFTAKQGHCEYFASAMVLMLRADGIPARLATGFLGAEYNPIEGYYIVRQSNAHAWVEAWLGDEVGWRQFDPTPPSGRPVSAEMSAALVLQQALDFIQFRWDRYVLTYGFNDQLQALGKLRQLWSELWRIFEGKKTAPAPVENKPGVEQPVTPAVPERPASPWRSWGLAGVLLLLVGGALALLAWRRPPLDGGRAYQRLRRRLERRGLVADAAVAPLEYRRRVLRRFPELRQPTERVIELYLRESFGAQPIDAAERAELEAALREVTSRTRKSA